MRSLCISSSIYQFVGQGIVGKSGERCPFKAQNSPKMPYLGEYPLPGLCPLQQGDLRSQRVEELRADY